MFRPINPMEYFSTILAVFLVLPIHEWAHAYTAYLLGDHTAKWEGRLSINPFRHLTLWGSLCLFLFRFGWAKPVPINPYNLHKAKNPKVGFAICAIAGPMANFFMALLIMILYKILLHYGCWNFFLLLASNLVMININLMVFNFLPIPPLDGSRIWSIFLSDEVYNKLLINEPKIILVVYILLLSGLLTIPLEFLSSIVLWLINILTCFIK